MDIFFFRGLVVCGVSFSVLFFFLFNNIFDYIIINVLDSVFLVFIIIDLLVLDLLIYG